MIDFKQSEISPGWRGSWYEMIGPNGTLLRLSRKSQQWIIRNAAGKMVSRYDSRTSALRRAEKLDAQVDDWMMGL